MRTVWQPSDEARLTEDRPPPVVEQPILFLDGTEDAVTFEWFKSAGVPGNYMEFIEKAADPWPCNPNWFDF